MVRSLVLVASLLVPAGAFAQDAIDLTTVTYHASVDVSAWPVTKTISRVELAPGTSYGVKVSLSPYVASRDQDPWPDFIFFPPDGHLRYTLWLFVRMNGQWHGAAVHEFWFDREWTGAPLLGGGYPDWIYANPGSPWGSMGDYVPQPGDAVGFMATAGDLRRHKDYFTVNQRTNVVVVPLAVAAVYDCAGNPASCAFSGSGTGGGMAGGGMSGTAGGSSGTAGGSAGTGGGIVIIGGGSATMGGGAAGGLAVSAGGAAGGTSGASGGGVACSGIHAASGGCSGAPGAPLGLAVLFVLMRRLRQGRPRTRICTAKNEFC